MKKLSAFLQEFQHVRLDYVLMLFMLFFMRTGQFMLLPFLAIYLTKFSHASPVIIGIVVGIGPFVYGVANVYAGVFVDMLGAKKIMAGSLFLGSAIFIIFFHQQTIAWCFLMNTLTGITRSFFDIGSKAYGITGLSVEQRKILFSLRYMVINSAAAIGPFLGAYFAATNTISSFKFVGLLYFFLGVLSIFLLKNIKNFSQHITVKFGSLIEIFRGDVSLQILVVINIIIMMVFSQLDSTLPQYLSANAAHGVKMYSILLIINAVIYVTMQLVVSKVTTFFNEFNIIFVGIVLYALSFILFALFLQDFVMISAVIILTFAEIIILPFNDALLVGIAPSDRIGTYYGISGFSMLGLGIGPMISGLIYEYMGAKSLFIICGVVSLLTLFFYKKLLVPKNEKN